MLALLPPFDLQRILLDPWRADPYLHATMLAAGFFVALGCGLVGKFLILRQMVMLGDALSHSILPGLVIVWLVVGALSPAVAFAGSVAAALATLWIIKRIGARTRLRSDAAIAVGFASFFALGLVLTSLYADTLQLDARAVLFGSLELAALSKPVELAGLSLGPSKVWILGCTTLAVCLSILFFYRQFTATTFDPVLATTLGFNSKRWINGMLVLTTLVLVTVFESTGPILALAMLVFPGNTLRLLCSRLSTILWSIAPLALLYALGGLHLSIWLDCSYAAAMTVVAGLAFCVLWSIQRLGGSMA